MLRAARAITLKSVDFDVLGMIVVVGGDDPVPNQQPHPTWTHGWNVLQVLGVGHLGDEVAAAVHEEIPIAMDLNERKAGMTIHEKNGAKVVNFGDKK